MIHEYALEPELVATWKSRGDARYFGESFGIGRGRLVSRYPRVWRKHVYDAAQDATDMEFKRLDALLDQLCECMVRRSLGHFDRTKGDWLENAQREHTQRPFFAILARDTAEQEPRILRADDISQEHPLWGLDHPPPPREANAMASAVAPALRISSTIIFVDPYFRPWKRRFRRSLKAFLREAVSARPGSVVPARVEILVADRDKGTEEYFRGECDRWLPRCIPRGVQVILRRLAKKEKSERLHSRYILTELGGIEFPGGLDEADEEGQVEGPKLLPRKEYEVRWAQYVGLDGEPPPSFRQVGPSIRIIGVRPDTAASNGPQAS